MGNLNCPRRQWGLQMTRRWSPPQSTFKSFQHSTLMTQQTKEGLPSSPPQSKPSLSALVKECTLGNARETKNGGCWGGILQEALPAFPLPVGPLSFTRQMNVSIDRQDYTALLNGPQDHISGTRHYSKIAANHILSKGFKV